MSNSTRAKAWEILSSSIAKVWEILKLRVSATAQQAIRDLIDDLATAAKEALDAKAAL